MEEQKALGVDLSIASKELIEAMILETADLSIFDEILKTNAKRPEILNLLIESPDTPENIKEEAARILQIPIKISAAPAKITQTPDVRSQTLLQRVQRLSVSEKRMLAMRGGREVRSILLKDTNKQVMMAVLENPKITESEIEILAHSRTIADEALREITKNKEWMRNYGIMLAVASNPKTPAGVAVNLLTSLKTRDLAILEKNKNVAEALRSAAKKLIQSRKSY